MKHKEVKAKLEEIVGDQFRTHNNLINNRTKYLTHWKMFSSEGDMLTDKDFNEIVSAMRADLTAASFSFEDVGMYPTHNSSSRKFWVIVQNS